MKFNYQARTKEGKSQVGVVEASNREAAFRVLKSYNLYVTILEKVDVPFYAQKVKFLERVTKKDVVLFSRQLAIMFKSKVPVVETLRTIGKQMRKATFREKILKITEAVEGGTPLSKAFSLYPKVFSPFYVNMVKSGEASGKLSEIFKYLADYLEKEEGFRSKIKAAMIYPIFILIVFVAVVGIIMAYVIPQLAEVLQGTGQELPLVTKIVITVSNFFKQQWWAVLLIMFALIAGLVYFFRTETGKDISDRTLVRIPIVKAFFRKLYLSRFALNLSTLISGGLPIAQALQITSEVVGNNVYRDIIIETKEGVKRGEQISVLMERHPSFISPLFYQMVVAGERTGSLGTALLNVVEFYQDDVDRSLDTFVRLLEPIFIVILGGVVAGLMGAVLMPLYSTGLM